MSNLNGGPAFPGDRLFNRDLFDELRDDYGVNHAREKATFNAPGMSLRDWFAGQATTPGMMELCTVAGVTIRGVNAPWDSVEPKFDEWWASLSNETRFALVARVRYQEADAMLAERMVPSVPDLLVALESIVGECVDFHHAMHGDQGEVGRIQDLAEEAIAKIKGDI